MQYEQRILTIQSIYKSITLLIGFMSRNLAKKPYSLFGHTSLFDLCLTFFSTFFFVLIYMPPLQLWESHIFGGSDSVLVVAFVEQVYQNLLNIRYLFYGNFYFPYTSPLSFSVMLLPLQIFYFPLRTLGLNIELSYNLGISFLVLFQILLLTSLIGKVILNKFERSLFVFLVFFNLSSAHYFLSHPQMICSTFSIILFLLLFLFPKKDFLNFSILILSILILTFSFDPSTSLMILLPILFNPWLLVSISKKFKIPDFSLKNAFRSGFLLLMAFFLVWFASIYREASRFSFASRPRIEIQTFSTTWHSFSLVPDISYFYSVSSIKWGEHEAMHFVGFVLPIVFLISSGVYLFNKKSDRRSRLAQFCLMGGILSYLFSFGPTDKFVNPIYEILSYLPGFSSVRSIGRIFLIVFPFSVLFIFLQLNKIRTFQLKLIFYSFLILSLLENRIVSYNTTVDSKKLFEKYSGLDFLLGKENVVLKLPFEGWPSWPSNISSWMLVVSQYNFRIIEGYSGASTPERDQLEANTLSFVTELDKTSADRKFKNFLALGIDSFLIEPNYEFKNEKLLKDYCQFNSLNSFRIYTKCKLD